ncbi:hypothetical protein L6252_03450 [Candidatus Parcubacteria bacterium]|nr:hypothetical protein [Candidatus Parcubacteria bacterium]
MDYSFLEKANFQEAVRKAAGITKRTGYEAQIISWWRDGELLIIVRKGGCAGCGGDEYCYNKKQFIDYHKPKIYPEDEEQINVHFHPDENEVIVPSFQDFKAMKSCSLGEKNGIGAINRNKILLIWYDKVQFLSDEAIEQLHDDLEDFYELPLSWQAEVHKVIESYGIKIRQTEMALINKGGKNVNSRKVQKTLNSQR